MRIGAKGNHAPYHKFSNTANINPGKYKGLWTGFVLEIEGQGEVFSDVSSKAVNLSVDVEVTKDEIKIYLK